MMPHSAPPPQSSGPAHRLRRLGHSLLGAALATVGLHGIAEAAPWVAPGTATADALKVARKGTEPAALGARLVFTSLVGAVADGQGRLRVEYDLVAKGGTDGRVVVVPLPAGTQASQAALFGAQLGEARFVTGDAAADVYSALAEGTANPEAVALVGHPLLLASLDGKLAEGTRFTVALELDRPVVADQERWLSLNAPPGPAAAQGGGPLSVELSIQGALPVRGVISPSHGVEVVRPKTAREATRVRFRGPATPESFELLWAEDASRLGLRTLTMFPADAAETTLPEGAPAEGYVLVLAQPQNPEDADVAAEPAREVVFVVDTSGSMRGEKWEQARGAILDALGDLRPVDRFNVVGFGTDVATFAPGAVSASAQQVIAAQAWLGAIVPTGRTNLGGALTAAVADVKPVEAAGEASRGRLVVLLTDGAPTAGEVEPTRILDGLAADRLAGCRVVAVGVGQDLDTWLLDQLATRTDGRVLYLDPEEDLDATVAALVASLRAPVLDGFGATLEVAAGAAEDADRFGLNPAPPRTLFGGQEVLFTARVPASGATLRLTGRGLDAGADTFVLKAPTATDRTARPIDRRFVATLWASHRVAAILQRLRLKGHDEKLATELVEIATRHGIVTEYTAFVADGGGELNDENQARANDNLLKGLSRRSGSWAVNQARNEQKLMNRKVASYSVENYRDQDGRQQQAAVQRVGGHVFYKKDGGWVEANANPAEVAAPVKSIKRYSDEYYELVKHNADFAKAQRLDGKMRMKVGDRQVEVE